MDQSTQLPEHLIERLRRFAVGEGRFVVLTGAGISAESGIPTFRGKEGYWVVGSREYQPQEMATHAMFEREPRHVWRWYLSRRRSCLAAQPNRGHEAVVALERLLDDRFLLITQNVDGLHLRAGSSPARTYQIHGNIDFARCDAACGQPIWSLEPGLSERQEEEPLSSAELDALHCAHCGAWARPHVLWFDECYDEEHFRFDSSVRAAVSADVLLVVGTSGATNLPMQVGMLAAEGGASIIDVNPEPNPFSQIALGSRSGAYLSGSSGEVLPAIVAAIQKVS